MSGFALAQVEIHNTSAGKVPLGYLNDGNRPKSEFRIRADYGGELSLHDAAGGLRESCAFTPAWWDLLANGYPSFTWLGGDSVPPGATVVMWALFAAPPADQRSVTVGIGGFTNTTPTPITAR